MPSSSRATLGVCFTLGVLAASLSTPLLAQSPAAQSGKEITIDRLFRPPSLGGRTTQGIEWAPDSKRFSYLDRQGSGKNAEVQLWTMDAATGERKVLVNAETLKSVMQPEKAKTSQSTGLGRVQADNYLWSPDANSLLFIGSNSLVLARSEDDDSQTHPHQRTRNRRSQIFARFPLDQFFPQRESLRREYFLRRRHRAHHRRQRRSPEGQARLGLSRRTRHAHRLLVVARLHENRVLRNGRAPGDALPHRGHEFAQLAAPNTRAIRKPVKPIPSCASAWYSI